MKTLNFLVFILFISISNAQVFDKKNLVLHAYYGVKARDYNIPSVFKESGVKLTNTNTIGLRVNYFLKNFLSVGFQVDYKKSTMKNEHILYAVYQPFTFEYSGNLYDVYYSPKNGSTIYSKTTLKGNLNFHILNYKKINWSWIVGVGYAFENFKSSVTIEDEETLTYEETYLNDTGDEETDRYTYTSFPSKNVVPFVLNVSTNLSFKLSEKMGANIELGLGNYNLALGIFYKLK